MDFQGCAILKLPWILFLFLVVFADEITNSTESNVTVTCEKEHDYDDLDIRKVMGKWGAVELYTHLSKEGVKMYQTCPMITIWETHEIPQTTYGPSTEGQLYHVQHIKERFQRDNRHLRLLWDEAGQTIEYSLYFRNDSAGYWHVYNEQNGTLASRPSYMHFNGAVQVLKAVSDHLVLNFCQKATNNSPAQLYSVLFSRDPGTLARWEIESVHALLQNKNLSVASRRMVWITEDDKLYS
ncbi:unnamed protein product, partial [Brenthis ino]